MNKEEIFRSRADELKNLHHSKDGNIKAIPVLAFFLSDEKYGLEAKYVNKVISLKKYTDLPCTPDFILGIISVESRILAIIDIKKLISLPEKGITNLNRVILVRNKEIEFGILADEIIGREEINAEDLQTSLPQVAEINQELIRGVTRDRLILLNTAALISDTRLIINEKI